MMRTDTELRDHEVLRRLLLLLIIFAVTSVMAGISRMWPSAWQLKGCADVLRVREALSMFVFAPIICVLFWMICRTVGRGRTSFVVDTLMILAVYAVACGMGIHDPTNRLISAYSSTANLAPAVRHSLLFLDDHLGHWVFWTGFVLGSWVVGIQQVLTPLDEKMSGAWRGGLGLLSVVLGWVMVSNLWDEYPKTRADLAVILLAVAGPLLTQAVMNCRIKVLKYPILLVMYPAYIGSVAVTSLYWFVRYGSF